MKISPIDIRKHTFEKGFRGYDIDEVDAFMNSLSQEWERVLHENKALKSRLESAENDLARMKDIEKTLYLTLKTAEETSQKITTQASLEAEQRIKDASLKSDALMTDAIQKANQLLQDAETRANAIKETIVTELANQEEDFRALEKHRLHLLDQLKNLVNTTTGIIEGFDSKFSDESTSSKLETLRENLVATPAMPVVLYTEEVLIEEEVVTAAQEVEVDDQQEAALEEVTAFAEEQEISEDDLLDAMIAEEEQQKVENTFSEQTGDNASIDVADQTLAEIARIRSSREENIPSPKVEEVVVPKKTSGSFFDEIG